MKKALIFDPYLDMLGGGERYVLTFALGLIKQGFEVEFAWPDKTTLSQATVRFGLDISPIKVNSVAYDLCRQKISLWQKIRFTKKYDLIFWVSDGSLPFLFSKNNLIHLQVPFVNIGGSKLINALKSFFINKFVYNSEFTKNVHEKNLDHKKSFVLYPPVDVESLSVGNKENIILSVARFSSRMTSKRQDVLIDAFRSFSSKIPGYKLILTGGLVGDTSIIENLKKQANGLNVEIIPNPDFNQLKALYSKAKFFWHTAGLGIDEEKEPEKVEHFGITTVEAMASGCIPLVINKGGQKEIVTPGTGFLCAEKEEIIAKTLHLISNPQESSQIAKQAIVRSQEFSTSKFYEKIKTLIS